MIEIPKVSTTDLESAAQTEDSVVGHFRRKSLDGLLNKLALFGNQIVGSEYEVVSPKKRIPVKYRHSF